MARTRVLVVGAGFAGLYAAIGLKRAARDGHRVTVVNPENFMQYQPFLPEVASGTIDPRAVVVPLRTTLRHCEIVVGTVNRVDHAQRRAVATLADGSERELGYDVIVIAPGSTSRVLPIPGLAENGVGFKTVQEAIHLRNHVLSRLDVAAASDDEDRRRAALTLVWTAGVRPSSLAKASGLPVDDAGRILTDDYLRVRGVDDAWAAGDAAAVPDRTTGALSPPTAQYGMRQGHRLARNVAATLAGRELEPFEHRNIGAVCSLGHYKGVAQIWGVKVKGFPAWFAHRTYHLYAMPTLTRRAKIAADWTVALLFPRDLAQLGSLERPREPFERAAKV